MKPTKKSRIAEALQINDRARISLRTILVSLAVSSLLACLVFADGNSRKPTQAEKDFSKSILNALAKALPSGPEG
jgi:hypothetical protein